MIGTCYLIDFIYVLPSTAESEQLSAKGERAEASSLLVPAHALLLSGQYHPGANRKSISHRCCLFKVASPIDAASLR